jgi:hypothetical protein
MNVTDITWQKDASGWSFRRDGAQPAWPARKTPETASFSQ